MTSRACSVLLALAVAACAASDGGETRPLSDPLSGRVDDEAWVLVWGDELDGAKVDPARWFARTGDLGHASTDNGASPDLATVAAGMLEVAAAPSPGAAHPYAAAYLETKGLFAQTYGKIEVRARCDYAPGVWYAIWGRPWVNAVPEIDIELLGENANQAWFVHHWALPPLPADQRRRYVTVDGVDIRAFHTYSITWTEDLVEWRIDDKPYMRITDGVPHEPMFWIMNAWVGGWGGTPSPSTAFPARLEVDWFRVYRRATWTTPPAIRIANARTTYRAGETIDVEIADFDRGARVEVWDGDTRITTLEAPPFRFRAGRLPPKSTPRAIRFVATDGARTASAELDGVVVE